MTESYYGGWIPGMPWHRRKWRKLGVKGEMKFRWVKTIYGIGAFEHCRVDDADALNDLISAGLPYPGAFSLVTKGEQS